MTDLWDSEAAEYFGGDESADWYDEGEDLDFGDNDLFGEVKSDAQKRHEAQRKAVSVARSRALEMRRRAAQTRPSARPRTAAAAIRQTRADVNRVNLQNRVQADAVGTAVRALKTRNSGLERAASTEVLGDAVNKELEKFRTDLGDGLTNALQSVIEFVPLVFIRSPERGLRNPAVLAGVAGGVLAITGLIIERLRDDPDRKTGVGGSDSAAPRSGSPTTK
jgi:hypothetical protein